MSLSRSVRGLLTISRHQRPLTVTLAQTNSRYLVLNLQRFYCQNIFSADSFSGASPTLVKFTNGFFKFEFQQKQYVLSYWTPVDALPEILCDSTAVEQNLGDANTSLPAAVKIIDMTGVEVPTEDIQPAIGLALSESNTVLIQFSDANTESVRLELDGLVGDLKTWEALENPPPKYEDQVRRFNRLSRPRLISVLEMERESLMTNYQPMSQEFKNLLLKAENQANNKFKWGGLFLLLAQLGFVARLTWFEYSWDIMEPITWCLTYTMLVGSYAYYVLTSQEYLLPNVERRMVQTHFWKNLQKQNFNVDEFKQLRQRLLAVEVRLGKAKGFPSVTSFPF